MPTTYKLKFAGEFLELRADRSLWWPAQRILFIADLHAGKTEHFQKAGLPIPSGNLLADLDRLQQTINQLQPQCVIILGDLFHSDINSEWQTVTNWIAQQVCSIELIRGNHDRFIDDKTFSAGGLVVRPEGFKIAPFTLRHHPIESTEAYILCGHLHPVHKYRGPGKDTLRLTCFVATNHQIVLPAFGSFTGGYEIKNTTATLIGTAPDFSSLIISQTS